MTYEISYAGGRCRNLANGRKDLLDWLEILRDETVTDIRKVRKDGTSESVAGRYGKYTGRTGKTK